MPKGIYPRKSIEERLYSKINIGKADECDEWIGALNNCGYGNISYNGKIIRVHRVIWELTNGSIKDGKYICHKCDNPKCVKLEHLFEGTQEDNMRDMSNKGRQKPSYVHGEKCGRHKLTEQQILEIRELYATGKYILKQLADRYDVSFQLISYIVNRKIWRHI